MDLIYTDKEKIDVGALDAYSLDMAYGTDEQNFALTLDLNDHCMEEGSFVYVDGEEYGGIVDAIEVITEEHSIIYSGRTWHGILAGKVICPPKGLDYLVLDGNANRILDELITAMDINGLFCASSDISPVNIDAYQMDRYIDGYSGIKKMLKSSGGKLKMRWIHGKIELSAVYLHDYSNDEEFDQSQVQFAIRRNYRPINHMICLGQGDLAKRAVIHLFTDENGGVQPYANKDTPLRDSDYILDESRKVLFDYEENCETLDYPSAEITLNYIKLTSQPSNWKTRCDAYYTLEDGDYTPVDFVETTEYILQKSKPSDWDEEYTSYFTKSGSDYFNVDGVIDYISLAEQPSDWRTRCSKYFERKNNAYVSVTPEVIPHYGKQKQQPVDWTKNYKSYFVWYSDGANTNEYRNVQGITKYKYKVQTVKPTDWADNCTSYYMRSASGGYASVKKVNDKAPKWKANTYFTRYPYQVAPAWDAEKRYTYWETTSAPEFEAGKYYSGNSISAPTWAKNRYYTEQTSLKAPTWRKNRYYKQVEDRYAVMIEEALVRLEEAWQNDEMQINLSELDTVYDIGDIVGTREETTGIQSVQEVVKKIIKIINDDITIEYEVK